MSTEPSISRDIKIVNQRGLHARASAKFVELVTRYDSNVKVEKDGLCVDGSSILDLMMLAASPGCSIRVTATGNEADAAIDAIEQLVAERFGEEL